MWIRLLLEVCRDSDLFVLGVVGDVAVGFGSSEVAGSGSSVSICLNVA